MNSREGSRPLTLGEFISILKEAFEKLANFSYDDVSSGYVSPRSPTYFRPIGSQAVIEVRNLKSRSIYKGL